MPVIADSPGDARVTATEDTRATVTQQTGSTTTRLTGSRAGQAAGLPGSDLQLHPRREY